MRNRLGVALIGQGPRPDCEAFFRKCLFDNDEIIIKGALDDLTQSEIKNLKPEKGDGVLAALDRNLVPIIISETEVKKRLPQKIRQMEEEGANIIVVFCTGQFPELVSTVPLILPGDVLTYNVAAIAKGQRVGVLVPEKEQIPGTKTKLRKFGIIPHVEAASPFGSKDFIGEACEKLTRFNPELIVMDCTSYDDEMKEIAREVSGKPVIAAQSILAKFISELAGK